VDGVIALSLIPHSIFVYWRGVSVLSRSWARELDSLRADDRIKWSYTECHWKFPRRQNKHFLIIRDLVTIHDITIY
jgi:hypothetical protein